MFLILTKDPNLDGVKLDINSQQDDKAFSPRPRALAINNLLSQNKHCVRGPSIYYVKHLQLVRGQIMTFLAYSQYYIDDYIGEMWSKVPKTQVFVQVNIIKDT